jgi:hypothetical protein
MTVAALHTSSETQPCGPPVAVNFNLGDRRAGKLGMRLDLGNLALRHQIAVLRRPAAKRLKLTSAGSLLWICLSRLWYDWRSALAIVKPETVLA